MFKENHYNWKIIINFLLISCMFSYFMMLFLYFNKMMFFFNWSLSSIENCNFMFTFFLEYKSFLFLFTVLIISTSISYYSLIYMEMNKNFHQFMSLLMTFIFSMIILIFSTNFFALMLGWDGLGISSFLLVTFYSNNNSLNAGYITLFTNRLGDIGLISCLYMTLNFYPTNISLMEMSNSYSDLFLMIILILSAFTKSAQIPFCAWLPAAMAAPTPVSSLVHSSTLVTAGVFILIRFNSMITPSFLALSIATLTTLIASTAAVIETDMKKIIALSTMSHLGMMMSMISLNFISLAFSHLIFHAFFKALLFMSVGLMIHLSNNYQDSRKISNLFYMNPINSLIMSISTLSLCGIPFLTGFYSKDFFLEILTLQIFSWIHIFIIYFICLSSYIYSLRLIHKMIFENSKSFSPHWTNNYEPLYYFSMTPLLILSIFTGKHLFFLSLLKTNILFLEIMVKIFLNFLIFICIMFSINFFSKMFLNSNNYFFITTYFFLIFLSRMPFQYSMNKWMKIFTKFDKINLVIFSSKLINNYNTLYFWQFLNTHFLKNFFFIFLLTIMFTFNFL